MGEIVTFAAGIVYVHFRSPLSIHQDSFCPNSEHLSLSFRYLRLSFLPRTLQRRVYFFICFLFAKLVKFAHARAQEQ